MKKLILIAVAASVLTTLTACKVHFSSFSSGWSDANLKVSTNVIQSAAIPAGLKDLAVDNPCGTVHITGTDNATTGWTWKLTIRAGSDAVAQQIATGAICKAEIDGDRLNLVVLLPDPREPHSLQSDFEITVPKTFAVHVQNRYGRTDIADLAGDVEATNANGRLEIRNIGGSVLARTSFDTLSLSNTGSATLKNQNGEIQAAGVHGSLQAATSFASLRVQDVRGPATLADQNGMIEATAITGSLDAKTSFESLEARDIGGSATLRNQNGRIEATDIGGALDAKTSFDSLMARDIGESVRLRDQNGAIKIDKAGGDVDVETSFDSLSAEGIQGDAILINHNGGLTANGITGSVRAATSFGTMEIAGAGSKFVCHNQNGAIRLRATSAALTNIEAKTSFDTLEVHLPADLTPAIVAQTSFADVTSDFPVLAKPRGVDPFADVAPNVARITLENQNGTIGVVRD